MSGIALLLGPVAFQGFEVPERLAFGGGQRLAVHRLPGGDRVIDTLGRDDADLTWSGSFMGSDAADRARLLDALRVAGLPLELTWDSFFYVVIIAKFEAEYRSPWWIPYRLTCTVLSDPVASLTAAATSIGVAAAADLDAASTFGLDVSAPQAALAAPDATTPGGSGYTAAVGAIGSALSTLDQTITTTQAQLTTAGSAGDFAGTVAAAGQLAQSTAARGYLARASANLSNASS
jgi:hypothetical protein